MSICDLNTGCSADTPLLTAEQITTYLTELPDWQLSSDGKEIKRELKVKGFAKATYLTNLAIWLADTTGHHPDVAFGWGYCTLRYTSHEAGGLTEADFACAGKFDQLLSA